MLNIIQTVRKGLKLISRGEIRIGAQNYFKEDVKFYGVKNGEVHKIAKLSFKEIKEKTKIEIFQLCEELWESGYMEESLIACTWSFSIKKFYEPGDFIVFEKWVKKYVNNWASCDTLCNHNIGTMIEMYPEFVSKLKKWTKSKNRWMRRASAVSLVVPGSRGYFLKDIFEIADLLLLDKDDLVQKGYGWMLKSASRYHQKEVFNYVMKNKKTMPRTALRYAIEKMPEELKRKAMAK